MITIIGLGVGDDELNLVAVTKMKEADEVLLRTAFSCQTVLALEACEIPYSTLDFLYERCRNYDTLTKAIVREVRRRAKDRNVCYCVDGSPLEDRAARALIRGRERVTVKDGVSKSAHAALLAGLDGVYQALSAYEISEHKLTLPLVVYDLADKYLAGDIKLLLAEKFGDEAACFYLNGSAGRKIALYEADRQSEYTPLTALVVYDIPLLEKKRFDFEDFIAVMRRLRAPDGCPWDRVQTHESIRINAVEEAYELVDAIDLNDPDKMREEAGDVLMQAAFHALIEEDKGNFTVDDVVTELCEKLITRHTHVFGTDKAAGADGALSVWEKNKMTEKHQVTYSDAVNDVPQCFPALLRAQKIAKRVEKGGWDSSTLANAEAKLKEEYAELLAAYEKGDKEEIHSELGDFLMCTAWLARAVGADAEMALLDAVKKIQKRYTAYESLVRADGKDPTELSQAEKDSYYERAKQVARA